MSSLIGTSGSPFSTPPQQRSSARSLAQIGQQPYSQVFAANAWIVNIIERTRNSTYSSTAGEGMIAGRLQLAETGPGDLFADLQR